MGEQHEREGWGLFEYDGTSLKQIQRVDEEAKFGSDADALAYVTSRAAEGSKFHQDALKDHRRDAFAIGRLEGREPIRNSVVRRVQVAVAFAAVLREWLTEEQMALVVADAANNPSRGCASHDFCDANMAMAKAFEATFGAEPELEQGKRDSEATVELWNAAWDLARRGGFDAKGIRSLLDEDLIEEATDAALDAACKLIQDYLGVTTGDLAGMHFSGSGSDEVREVLRDYLQAERASET